MRIRHLIRLMLNEVKDMPPGFWAWFGDSVLANPDGSPIRLYHGTTSSFNVFKPSGHGKYGPGIYVTGVPLEAAGYAMGSRHSNKGDASVMPVYARLENPLTLLMQPDSSFKLLTRSGFLSPEHEVLQDKMSTVKGAVEVAGSHLLTDMAKRLGHDGLIVDMSNALGPDEMEQLSTMDPDTAIEEILQQIKYLEVVLFSPSQIKSAIGNAGSWSRDEEDIMLEQSEEIIQITEQDRDGDGDEDFDDVRVARFTASGMTKDKALVKVKKKPLGKK